MANGVKYKRVGGVNVGEVETAQQAMDRAQNAQLRSSEVGMGMGIGGAIGTIWGPVGTLVGSGIGAAVGGIVSLFTGKDEREEAKEAAQRINESTELANLDRRDRAASEGMRKRALGLYAANGKNPVLKQRRKIGGMLLPLNR